MSPPAKEGDTGDVSLFTLSGIFPERGNGYSLQYSCLENPTNRGSWWVTVHGATKSQARLSNLTHTYPYILKNVIFFT